MRNHNQQTKQTFQMGRGDALVSSLKRSGGLNKVKTVDNIHRSKQRGIEQTASTSSQLICIHCGKEDCDCEQFRQVNEMGNK